MGLLDVIRRTVGGEGPTYEYVCTFCGTTFESSHRDVSAVTCPECASTEVRSARRAAE